MKHFIRITPVMHVDDVSRAVAFFRDTLGFHVYVDAGTYAYVQRESAAVRILQNSGSASAPAGTRRFAYYIDVEDLDALLAQLQPQLDRLPPGNVTGPVTQPYGQRELMLLAPDGNLLVFGQTLGEPASH